MNVVEALHVLDDPEPRSAAMNMALDEAILNHSILPRVRFYRWQRPALSFGYFARFADAHRCAAGRQVVRRPTGGGIVLHGNDLTYSFFAPRGHPFCAQPPVATYAALHHALVAALRAVGFDAALADHSAPRVSDACFANPVRADVLVDGRKAAGAAQRRSRVGLLHQGSVQLERLPLEFAGAFALQICAVATRRSISAAEMTDATQIAAQKYDTTEWLMRR